MIWIGAIAGLLLLLEAFHAIRPFIWAIVTAYIFHPVVSFIHRKTHLPKHLITVWLYLMLGLLITILVINLVPSLIQQAEDIQSRIPEAVDKADAWLERHQLERLERLGIRSDFVDQRLSELGNQIATAISDALLPFVLGTFTVLIELFVYLVASFYFIVYGDKFVLAIRNILSRRYHREVDRLLMDINTTLGAYIRGQALLVVIMSTASYIALRILEVDYALVVAISTGFLELIPIVGPCSACAIAVSVGLFQDTTPFGWSNLTLAVAIGLVYFTLRQMEDVFVIPLLIGRIVHLHPLLVIFVVVVGTTLGGILGLLLAVPLAAVIGVLCRFALRQYLASNIYHGGDATKAAAVQARLETDA